MPKHSCTKCGKQFKKACRLKRHLARKTPCALILEPEDNRAGEPRIHAGPIDAKNSCPFCKRPYASYNSMRRHVRKNCKIAPNKKNGNAGMEKLAYMRAYTIKRQQAQIDEMATMMKKQSQMMSQLLGDKQGGSNGMQGSSSASSSNAPLR